VFWAGSDDGLVHISRDGGKSWDNVTPPGLPEWATVAIIEPSPHDSATTYVAAHRYRLADNTPLLFKTTDQGKTWQRITDGIPDTQFTWVIRADPERAGLLYAGTELGVYVSLNDGDSWQPLQGKLPVAAVRDMKIRGNELAVATHGRSFWILDDLTVIRQAANSVMDSAVHLFKPANAYRSAYQMAAGRSTGPGKKYMLRLGASVAWEETKDENEEIQTTILDGGHNPPFGVTLHYYIKDGQAKDAALTVSDSNGQALRTIGTKPASFDDTPESEREVGPFLPVKQGMNRFVWDMRHDRSSRVIAGGAKSSALEGPLVLPGTYTISLTVAGETKEQQVVIDKDPRVTASDDDFRKQLDMMLQVRDKVTEVHDGIIRIRSVRSQVNEWAVRAKSSNKGEALAEVLSGLTKSLGAVELELIQTKAPEEEGLDKIALPSGIGHKLKELMAAVSSADAAPTSQQYDVYKEFSEKADGALGRLEKLVDEDVQRFVDMLHELEVPAIVPKA
jgi:hypothetical protein